MNIGSRLRGKAGIWEEIEKASGWLVDLGVHAEVDIDAVPGRTGKST